MDMNIVPSKFGKNMFESIVMQETDKNTQQVVKEHRLLKPIEVLFEGADINIYKKVTEHDVDLKREFSKIKESFVFLYVGHWLQGPLGHDRKDTGMMVKTFFEAFKNKAKAPALVMKTSGAGFSILDREDILMKIEQIKATVNASTYPNIYLLHGDFTDAEMNDLYNQAKVKAHISFTHGEGYGRPLAEAIFSEKPIIAPNWSGHLDFLNSKYVTLLPGAMTDVHPNSLQKGLVVKGAKWFTVNYNYARNIMIDIFKNYGKYNKNLKSFATITKSKFSLDAMTAEFEAILNRHLPEFQTNVSLTLPKLKKKNAIPDLALPKMKSTEKPTLPKLKKV
jgi:glycosyltransferase involved in cell wall biosynthesis